MLNDIKKPQAIDFLVNLDVKIKKGQGFSLKDK